MDNEAISGLISHYRILKKLGAGGMGEVYLAEDTKLRRKVAIKTLSADLTKNEDRLHRFEQEAQAASGLNHPNILTIHEIGSQDGRHFIATEFIEGETLRQRLARSHLTIHEVLDISVQVASALVAAHSAGIIHRDIKPENLMLRPDGYVKVLDFGLAKLTERQASTTDTEAPTVARVDTNPGTVMGTLSYMSPEQARGKAVDPRSDVFSLGVVVYEMIAGRAPFEGETPSDVISFILQVEPPPLTRVAPDVPSELERIVTKALAKDKEERYQTVKDMLIDLKRLKHLHEVDAEIERSISPEATKRPSGGAVGIESVSGSGEVAARTTSSAEYIITEIRRHKRGAAAVLILTLVVIAALAYVLYFVEGKKAIDSIAVLPLVNVGADPNTEYLSDGIAESISNSLSQLTNLKVMSRSSVFSFKGREITAHEVGEKLGVRAVLTGRVAQRGESLTISLQLEDARDNSLVWGQQYNRKLADVFALQEEIAREISQKLRLQLTGDERQQLARRPTENLKAFQYYMQGRSYTQRRTREDLLTAVRYCERAIDEDRNYALAYAGLADAYGNLGIRGYIAPPEARRKAEDAARQSLALDENLAEAHVALGQAYTYFTPSNFSLGDRELRRAVALSPSLALAHFYLGVSLVRQGRLDQGLEECMKARELDPLSSAIARVGALPYYCKRDYVRALELLRQANELGPGFVTTWEIGIYIQNRLFDDPLAEIEKAKLERKSDPILIYDTGMIYAGQGKTAEALRIVKELEEMSGESLDEAQLIAKIYAVLNEKEMAVSWLERGLATGAIGVFYKDEPVWDLIRSDPRFADLLRRMGIPQ
jgi:eukaryotic-like serine/threonine-protein kinase